jgi:hypothetical protein
VYQRLKDQGRRYNVHEVEGIHILTNIQILGKAKEELEYLFSIYGHQLWRHIKLPIVAHHGITDWRKRAHLVITTLLISPLI